MGAPTQRVPRIALCQFVAHTWFLIRFPDTRRWEDLWEAVINLLEANSMWWEWIHCAEAVRNATTSPAVQPFDVLPVFVWGSYLQTNHVNYRLIQWSGRAHDWQCCFWIHSKWYLIHWRPIPVDEKQDPSFRNYNECYTYSVNSPVYDLWNCSENECWILMASCSKRRTFRNPKVFR